MREQFVLEFWIFALFKAAALFVLPEKMGDSKLGLGRLKSTMFSFV